jgi:CheY-like chemotaxis protein
MTLAVPSDFRDNRPPSRGSWSNRSSTGPRARLPRALVVEDADDFRELFASELERVGFAVAQASTGEEALEQVLSFRPDVIVLDLMLPGLNGFGVARAVRTLELERSVAIVAVTALSSEPLRRMALDSGCDRFLTKPVVAATLAEEAVRMIHESRSRGSGRE